MYVNTKTVITRAPDHPGRNPWHHSKGNFALFLMDIVPKSLDLKIWGKMKVATMKNERKHKNGHSSGSRPSQKEFTQLKCRNFVLVLMDIVPESLELKIKEF